MIIDDTQVDGETVPTVEFSMSPDVSGVVVTVEESNDLETWTPSAVLIEQVSSSDSTTSYKYRMSDATVAEPKSFIRVRAELEE